MRSTLVAIAVIALSSLASSHRWGDSAHAMGLVSVRGGKARHPVHLTAGKSRYTLVVTATVLPPFRGNVEVELVGNTGINCRLAATEAVVDLGIRRHPHFIENTFFGVQAGDRLALWVVILADDGHAEGTALLQFHDQDSGQSLLQIPVVFDDPGKAPHGR